MRKNISGWVAVILMVGLQGGSQSAWTAEDNPSAKSSQAASDTASASSPELGKEHVILHTNRGDLVLGFYPKVAPQTVEQLLKLFKAKVYDGTRFVRVIPGFVAQITSAYDRNPPLDAGQTSLIHKIPAEFSDIPHVRGILSMAREDADINSNETSFSILLGDAHHLDHKYTVFGELEQGQDVLTAIENEPVKDTENNEPKARMVIQSTEVVSSAQLKKIKLAPASQFCSAAAQGLDPVDPNAAVPMNDQGILACLTAVLGLTLLVGIKGKTWNPRVSSAISLVATLITGFVIYAFGTPMAQKNEILGGIIFVGIVAMLRAMGEFESGPRPK